MSDNPIIIERTFNAPLETLWKAITDKNEMKQWYFDLKEFKPEIGFEFQFFGGSDKKQYKHLCKVTEVVVGKKLSYSWHYEGYEGMSIVRFELLEEGAKTNVRLTHSGVDTFPKNEPDFARKSFEEGWTYIIGTSLKGYSEKS